jgi:hypothetical protein
MKTLKQLSNERYYSAHKDEVNSRRREKYAKDPDTNLARQKEVYRRDPSQKLASQQAYYAQNKDAINARQRMRWATDEEYRTKFNIRNKVRNYGITVEEYLELYKQTDGKCTVCEKRPTKRALHIDHNHKTGSVRGLLCHHCNTALGLLKEDAEIINKLLAYLKSK